MAIVMSTVACRVLVYFRIVTSHHRGSMRFSISAHRFAEGVTVDLWSILGVN